MELNEISLYYSATSIRHFPIYLKKCVVDEKDMFVNCPIHGEWGLPQTIIDDSCIITNPCIVDITYISLIESIEYHVIVEINEIEFAEIYKKAITATAKIEPILLIGFAPNGFVNLWMYNADLCNKLKISSIIKEKKIIDVKQNNDVLRIHSNYIEFDEEYRLYLENRDLINYPQTHKYEYLYAYKFLFTTKKLDGIKLSASLFDNESEGFSIDYIKNKCFCGSVKTFNIDDFDKYQKAGAPEKIVTKWSLGESEYSAYFWFNEDDIFSIFDKFWGIHREFSGDMLFYINSDEPEIELYLNRYGLQCPIKLNRKCYQLIVFKDGFELFRSENFDQRVGAWIW